VTALVALLAPVIQARVARRLAARGRSAGRDIREELRDITQEVFVCLFERDARTLRAWHCDGGLSLRNFVGLVAEREVASILRSRKRSPWVEDAAEPQVLDCEADERDVEAQLSSRESLQKVVDELREQLSPLGLQLFGLLLVEGLDVDDVCVQMGMTRTAVYTWRSRLADQARAVAARLAREKIVSCLVSSPRRPRLEEV